MKIVINRCYGGFSLSEAAYKFLKIPWDGYGYKFNHEDRSNPQLVKCVEKLGKLANGKYAELNVVEIPDGTEYQIEEYDGVEWVAEKHKTWP